MSADAKTTNDVRMIAQDVARQQAEVCSARRDSLDDKLKTISDTVSANSTAIAALTQTVTTLAATVQANTKATDEHDRSIGVLKLDVQKLKSQPALLAVVGSAIGSAVPIIVGLLFWLMNR